MTASILAQSPGELTDAELQAAVTVCAARRDELVAEARHGLADGVAGVLDLLVDERDARRHLRHAVDDAMSPVQIVGTWQLPDDDE